MSPDLFEGVYRGRRVLVTGDTGFVGGWTTRWLVQLGAEVAGYSRGAAAGHPGAGASVAGYRGDITDRVAVVAAVEEFAPEIVLHLAGTTTVAAGFRSPLGTFEANVTGTAALLHAALRQPATRVVVVVGTPAEVCLDDRLELNPYPASKLGVEAVVGAYAHPRTQSEAGRATPLHLAVARPGVMVGGDWAEGRLLADVVRNVRHGEPVVLRAAGAVRPWQHVLEGVGGMLTLAARLYLGGVPRRRYAFGRLAPERAEPVVDVVTRFLAALGVPQWPVRIEGRGGDRVELGAAAARAELGWSPVWDLERALRASAAWYQAGDTEATSAVVEETITAYCEAAAELWKCDLLRA